MAMKVTYTVLDGEIISENRNGVERDYMPDPQGNTLALLDNTQTKTDTFSYWPYGEVKTRTGNTPTPFQYLGTLGYYMDSSTKSYVRARYLDTQKGRWLTTDPIRFAGGDWNLYAYCSSSPQSLVDPSGLERACPGFPKQSRKDCYWCYYYYFIGKGSNPVDACQSAAAYCLYHDPKNPNCKGPFPKPKPAPTPGGPSDPCTTLCDLSGSGSCAVVCYDIRNGRSGGDFFQHCADCCSSIGSKFHLPQSWVDHCERACKAGTVPAIPKQGP